MFSVTSCSLLLVDWVNHPGVLNPLWLLHFPLFFWGDSLISEGRVPMSGCGVSTSAPISCSRWPLWWQLLGWTVIYKGSIISSGTISFIGFYGVLVGRAWFYTRPMDYLASVSWPSRQRRVSPSIHVMVLSHF